MRDTGFHPLHGARHLAAQNWPMRLCGLVAHHSGAVFVADALGLREALAEFPDETGLAADALTYADQTTGPDGEDMTVDHRIADLLRRHGPSRPNAQVHPLRGPYLCEVVDRVEAAFIDAQQRAICQQGRLGAATS